MKFTIVKPIYGIIGVAFIGLLFLILPVVMLINRFIIEGVLFLLLWAFVFFFGVIHQCFIKSIVINNDGVRYITLFKTLEMRWQDISIIGIGYVPIKKPGKKPWIYFNTDKVAISMLVPNMINERFFMMQYRRKVIEEIKEYWPNEIVGLDNLK